jgi:diaminohydroxyphosphoribosylaminopyrimidine deaminase/5-amino-6-(5-phosphoribosylamino)uracil reductase
MRLAIELSRRCPPVAGAYSVGAIIVDVAGLVLAHGHSRENDPHAHAEEAALGKVTSGVGRRRLAGATLYTTLEPCSVRASRRTPCAPLVVAAGIRRVVLAWREPALFVLDCQGVELLQRVGVEVVELVDMAEEARRVNAHLAV